MDIFSVKEALRLLETYSSADQEVERSMGP